MPCHRGMAIRNQRLARPVQQHTGCACALSRVCLHLPPPPAQTVDVEAVNDGESAEEVGFAVVHDHMTVEEGVRV